MREKNARQPKNPLVRDDIAKLLEQTLDEEKAVDSKPTPSRRAT
jgi:ferritin-like metal-binding protein YciE